MTTPHEIIAGIRYKPISFETKAIGGLFASAVISDLRSAGFHILSDADLQATVEALEAALPYVARYESENMSNVALDVLTKGHAAIRAMQGGKP